MSEIAPISAGRLERLDVSSASRQAYSLQEAPARPGDHVEVSSMANFMNKLRNLPIRQSLVDDVRRQIAAGTYETPDKLDAAVRELAQEL